MAEQAVSVGGLFTEGPVERRKAVVDQQDRFAAKVEWRMLSVQVPVEKCSLRFRLLNGDRQPLNSQTVRGAHVDPVTGRDRSDAVFTLEGMADLPHRNDIERCAERPGDLRSDLDAAPREADDDDIAATLGSEFHGKCLPGRCAVGEEGTGEDPTHAHWEIAATLARCR